MDDAHLPPPGLDGTSTAALVELSDVELAVLAERVEVLARAIECERDARERVRA